MRARVVEAEAQVPMAMAEAFRSGNLGVMDLLPDEKHPSRHRHARKHCGCGRRPGWRRFANEPAGN